MRTLTWRDHRCLLWTPWEICLMFLVSFSFSLRQRTVRLWKQVPREFKGAVWHVMNRVSLAVRADFALNRLFPSTGRELWIGGKSSRPHTPLFLFRLTTHWTGATSYSTQKKGRGKTPRTKLALYVFMAAQSKAADQAS